MPELTAEDLAVRIGALEQQVAEMVRLLGDTLKVTSVVLSRVTDVTHLSVREAAAYRNCTEKTIRRRIASGVYTLECIPGTGVKGIPIEQVRKGWIDARAAEEAERRDRQDAKR